VALADADCKLCICKKLWFIMRIMGFAFGRGKGVGACGPDFLRKGVDRCGKV